MLFFEQDIGTLVILFCIFHACVGFILPSLARLRTMWVTGARTIEFKLLSSIFYLHTWHHCRYLPNELRGGMMSFSLSLANAGIFVFLLQVAIWSPLVSEHICCAHISKRCWQRFLSPAGCRSVANSTILGLASCGPLGAGGCIHMLRRWRKHTRQNARSL